MDIVVVTTPFYYEEIVDKLKEFDIRNVISLVQIIDELEQRICFDG